MQEWPLVKNESIFYSAERSCLPLSCWGLFLQGSNFQHQHLAQYLAKRRLTNIYGGGQLFNSYKNTTR